MCINSEILGEKNQECSESSELPRKVIFSGKHKMCINSEILGEKNQECSESSELPRKVIFRHF